MASSSSSSSPEISNSSHNNNAHDHFSFKYASQEEVLEDLSSRFILNLPDEELASVERICFQVEQAHWFYEDFIREENPKFPTLPLKKFSAMLFKACPMLQQWSHDHEQAFNTFMQYKTRVPVCGAIMLNDTLDKCVLVKGWKSSSGWGFPKGKINQDEEPHRCAVREVLEETGYDLSRQIQPEFRVEMTVREQHITLYIVAGVPEDYPFHTRTRKEISKIEWFPLFNLPTWRRNKTVPGKFYLISPFVPYLKEYINARKNGQQRVNHKVPKVKLQRTVPSALPVPEDSDYVAMGRDVGLKGSSSQSSSADNGDPHTPSPQYKQAYPVSLAIEDDQELNASTQSIDPHFARLLSGLSLSATNTKAAEKSTAGVVIPSPLHADHSPKTKALKSMPEQTSVEDISSKITASAPLDADTGQTPPAVANVSKQSLPSPRISPEDEVASTGIPASENHPSTSTLGRRMKQLALLESLASDHLRPATMAPLDPGRTGPHIEQFAMHAPLQRGPPLPAGFMHQPSNRYQMAVPYPSGPGPMPFPHTLGRRFQPPQDDPFQVRPRTSNAVFPPSLHMPIQTHAPHSMSMHQGQLLAMMGGNNPNFNGMTPPQPPPIAPSMQLPNMRPFPQANTTPILHTSQHDRQLLRVIPPFASSQIEPGPFTAPNMPPNFGLPGAAILPSKANAASLLSILNIGQPSMMNNSIPIPQYSAGVGSSMPPGALLNGTMHR